MMFRFGIGESTMPKEVRADLGKPVTLVQEAEAGDESDRRLAARPDLSARRS